MQCFKCQTECSPGAKFCHNCGRNFTKTNRGPQGAQDRGGITPQNEFFNMREESLAAHAELKGRNLMKALIAGVCAVVLTGRVLVGSHGDSFFLAAFVFIGGIGFASWLFRVSKSQYYALPHSTDGFGETRCIWCGNKGIWRKGQYKSNITHSHCSKCKERLFSS